MFSSYARRSVSGPDNTPLEEGAQRNAHASKSPIIGAMVLTRSFHTPCQEEVYKKVKRFLDELVDEHFDDAEHCDFYLKYGSTLLEISIAPYEEDNAVIEILAYCVQGVDPSFELMRDLLSLNSQIPLGAFSLVGDNVYYSHAFLGRQLLPDQLIASLSSVANIADEYDEKIVERYGGQTALERLTNYERRSRRESLSN
jgi:hypothetical protein